MGCVCILRIVHIHNVAVKCDVNNGKKKHKHKALILFYIIYEDDRLYIQNTSAGE